MVSGERPTIPGRERLRRQKQTPLDTLVRIELDLQFTMKSKFALAECLSQVDEELLPKEAAENLYGKEEGLVSKGNPTGTVLADPRWVSRSECGGEAIHARSRKLDLTALGRRTARFSDSAHTACGALRRAAFIHTDWTSTK